MKSEKEIREHGRLVCSGCGNETFRIIANPYSKLIIPQNHYELVCLKCSRGCAVEMKILMDIRGNIIKVLDDES